MATLFSATIVSVALTAVSNAHELALDEQKTLDLTSAARLFQDVVENGSVKETETKEQYNYDPSETPHIYMRRLPPVMSLWKRSSV